MRHNSKAVRDINAQRDFIAGDQYNYYYTGDFASLAEYYISPESVFQRVRTDDFIGRDWLTTKVDAFLKDPNRKSGAFLLIGDAGVGKTSFMAHLVKERRYLHLFAEQAPGQAMVQRAMQSLGSQLVTRYQIDPYKDRDTLNALSVFPDFLERILRLAASTLTEGEKIVIVCDALDEAGTFPDHFVFGLPKELPDGVYFILSQRPVNVKLPNFEPVIEKLEAQGEGNLQDIEAYLSAVAKRPEVVGQIRSKEYSEEFFIQTLKEKSQGVWMYLHYIIKEIESGARAPLDLANLPTGLVGYYAEYWDAWRTGKRGKGEEAWDELYAPLLTTLAAAQEAISVDWLIQWADVTAKPREVTRLLTEHWRAFITEKEKDGQKTYTPYHLSFKDFITGRVDTSKLQPAQANLVKDLAAQTVGTHKRIVKVFEKECNGEWEKLMERDYPRLHLTAHLNGAGEYEILRVLLTEGDEKIKWAEAREQKEETYAGYLNDLTYVWDFAEQKQNYTLAIRCMLIENSIRSLAANIPPELLVGLAKTGIWSYARCLSIIRQKSDSKDQAKSLELIAPNLQSLLFQDALFIAQGIKNKSASIHTLITLVQHFNEEFKLPIIQKTLLTAREIKDISDRVRALSYLMQYLDNESKMQVLHECLASINEIKDNYDHAIVLSSLVPFLFGEHKDKVIKEILAANKTIGRKDHEKIDFLCSIVSITPLLSEKLKVQFLQDTLTCARAYQSATIISSIAPYLSKEFIEKALTIALELKDESARLVALSSLIPFLFEEIKEQALQEALSAIRTVEDKFTRVKAMPSLDPFLPEEFKVQVFQEALSVARKVTDNYFSCIALIDIIQHISPKNRLHFLQETLMFSHKIDNEQQRAYILHKIVNAAHDLYGNLIEQSLSIAHEFKNKSFRINVFLSLIPFLPLESKEQVLQEALSVSREIEDESVRVSNLLSLIPFLPLESKEQVLQEALSTIWWIPYDASQAKYLSALAPFLSDELASQALTMARKIKFEKERASTILALALHLSPELKTQVLQEALSATCEIVYEYDRARVLSDIAPHLSRYLTEQALTAAREIKDGYPRALALLSLVPYLSVDIEERVLIDVFSALRMIDNETSRVIILENIVNATQHLSVDLSKSSIIAAYDIKDEYLRALALLTLISHLDVEVETKIIQEVFSVVNEIKNEYNRAQILLNLATHLKDTLQIVNVLNQLLYLQVDMDKVLTDWNEIGFKDLNEHIFPFIKSISLSDQNKGLDAIRSLTPALIHFSGEEIVPELYRTITDVTRWWP